MYFTDEETEAQRSKIIQLVGFGVKVQTQSSCRVLFLMIPLQVLHNCSTICQEAPFSNTVKWVQKTGITLECGPNSVVCGPESSWSSLLSIFLLFSLLGVRLPARMPGPTLVGLPVFPANSQPEEMAHCPQFTSLNQQGTATL